MNRDDEETWGKIVLICTAFLAVLFIAKLIFWLSVIAGVIGFIWLLAERDSGDTTLPALVFVVAILLALISWCIGYWFETTEIGSSLKDAASAVVEADNTIKDTLNNVTESLGNP